MNFTAKQSVFLEKNINLLIEVLIHLLVHGKGTPLEKDMNETHTYKQEYI